MDTNEKILEQLISNNRRAILYHLVIAIVLFVVGAVVIVFTLASSPNKDIPSAVSGIAGAFTSSLSALQIKEVLARREKTEVFLTIRSRYQSLRKSTSKVDREERQRLIRLMSQIVEKAALG